MEMGFISLEGECDASDHDGTLVTRPGYMVWDVQLALPSLWNYVVSALDQMLQWDRAQLSYTTLFENGCQLLYSCIKMYELISEEFSLMYTNIHNSLNCGYFRPINIRELLFIILKKNLIFLNSVRMVQMTCLFLNHKIKIWNKRER